MNQDSLVLEKYSQIKATAAVSDMKYITGMMTLEADDNVLDVGCGTGHLTKILASQVHSVTGLDIMPGMIDVAIKYQSEDNIKYVVADACDINILEKYSNTFDKVIANLVVHWNNNQQTLLEGFHQYLKPGGQCFLNVCCTGLDNDAVIAIAESTKDPKWAKYMEGCEYPFYPYEGSCDEFKEDLRKAGFRNIECRSDMKKFTFENRNEAQAGYRIFMNPANRIPKELREQYLEYAFDRAIEKSQKTGDGYTFSTLMISAIGCK